MDCGAWQGEEQVWEKVLHLATWGTSRGGMALPGKVLEIRTSQNTPPPPPPPAATWNSWHCRPVELGFLEVPSRSVASDFWLQLDQLFLLLSCTHCLFIY